MDIQNKKNRTKKHVMSHYKDYISLAPLSALDIRSHTLMYPQDTENR